MAIFLASHLLGLCTSSAHLHMFLYSMMVIDPVPSTTQFPLVSPFLPTYVIHTGPSIITNFNFLNFFQESVSTPIPAGAVVSEERDDQWKAKPRGLEVLF